MTTSCSWEASIDSNRQNASCDFSESGCKARTLRQPPEMQSCRAVGEFSDPQGKEAALVFALGVPLQRKMASRHIARLLPKCVILSDASDICLAGYRCSASRSS